MAEKTVCPHCGKPLANPEKLGWHLARECPALLSLTNGQNSGKDSRTPQSGS